MIMEDNKTITMPLSEYRRMEEQIAEMKLKISARREDKESFLREVIGMHTIDIFMFINKRKPYCKTLWQAFRYDFEEWILTERHLNEEISALKKTNSCIDSENQELKCKITKLEKELSKYKQKKWWELWK